MKCSSQPGPPAGPLAYHPQWITSVLGRQIAAASMTKAISRIAGLWSSPTGHMFGPS